MDPRASHPCPTAALLTIVLATFASTFVACSRPHTASAAGAAEAGAGSRREARAPGSKPAPTSAAASNAASANPAGSGPDAGPAVECRRDEDCVLAPWPLPDAPCCDAPYTAVQARSTVEARAAERKASAACKAYDCAAALRRFQGGPPPAPPAKCYFEPRCRKGRCGPAC